MFSHQGEQIAEFGFYLEVKHLWRLPSGGHIQLIIFLAKWTTEHEGCCWKWSTNRTERKNNPLVFFLPSFETVIFSTSSLSLIPNTSVAITGQHPCIFELQRRSTAIKHEWAAAANSHWGFKHTNKSLLRGKLRCGIMYAGMYSSRSSYKTRLLWGKSGINYSGFYMRRIQRIKGLFWFSSRRKHCKSS